MFKTVQIDYEAEIEDFLLKEYPDLELKTVSEIATNVSNEMADNKLLNMTIYTIMKKLIEEKMNN